MIGRFEKNDEDILTGVIQTLTIDRLIEFRPVPQIDAGSPHYRAYVSGTDNDCGEAWKMKDDDGQPFLMVKLDDPTLSAPIKARMTKNPDESYSLWWFRQAPDYPPRETKAPYKSRGKSYKYRP